MVKTYRVVIAQEAWQNLKEITDYIRRADSESKAKYVRTEVLKLARSLTSLPGRYPEILTSMRTGITYRYIPNKYKVKVIYNVQEEKGSVIIVRIYHDAQSLGELEKLLL